MNIFCPCCGYDTLTVASNYEVCPICFWEDVPATDLIMRITSNRVTLLQAQQNFLAIGACEAEFRTLTRPPTAMDKRLPDWQPLAERLRQEQQNLLASLLAYPTSLLELLAPQLTDELLHAMATADRGMDVEQHLAGLRQLRSGEIPIPMRWEPLEVLRLVRWSGPDQPTQSQQASGLGRSGHLQRAFACTALLLAGMVPGNRELVSEGNQSTIIQLIASLVTFDEELMRAGARLVSEWMLRFDLESDERPFCALGILLLVAALPQPAPVYLAALATWVLAEEARCRDRLIHAAPWQEVTEQWLLGLTNYNLRHETWQALTVQILSAAASKLPAAQATSLVTIVAQIQR